jgi:hypothetical protein
MALSLDGGDRSPITKAVTGHRTPKSLTRIAELLLRNVE